MTFIIKMQLFHSLLCPTGHAGYTHIKILKTTTIPFSGLNTDPAFSIPPASDSCFKVCPRSSLQACRLSFSLVGFTLNSSAKASLAREICC